MALCTSQTWSLVHVLVFVNFDKILSTFWQNCDKILSKFWQDFVKILSKNWHNVDNIFTTFWQNFGNILSKFWQNFDKILSKFWQNFVKILTNPGSQVIPRNFSGASFPPSPGPRFWTQTPKFSDQDCVLRVLQKAPTGTLPGPCWGEALFPASSEASSGSATWGFIHWVGVEDVFS